MNPETKKKKIEYAEEQFKIWCKEKYPIYDKEGTTKLELHDNECFVPLYDYKENCFNDKCYYISNYGNIITFSYHGADRPYTVKPHKKNSKQGYLQIDADYKKHTKWKLHEAVWYSFMADSVINKNYYPELHQSGFEFNVDSLEEFQQLLEEYKEGLELHVHHESLDTCHNVLADLAALPKVLHNTLHNIANTKDEIEQFFKTALFSKFIVDNTPERTATWIFPDKKNGVRMVDKDYDESIQKAARNDIIVGSIATQIIKDFSYDYLKTHRLVQVSGIKDENFHSVRAFEIFIIGDKEKGIEIGFHSYKPDASLDYDIFVDFETKTIEYVKENKTISFGE